jgi:predicted transcriptional regulator
MFLFNKPEKNQTVSRILFIVALVLGAIAIVWMGSVFIASDIQAFIVIVTIGIAYGIGILELIQYRYATLTLHRALSKIQDKIENINEWLDNLDVSLRTPVRMRIEGERTGLPTPVLTPYLVGLLVMLGLLGTFVGMVDTLKGAVTALEGTTEIQAIRNGLATPIKGLSLAFGTSVAGVAASAMLGLMSTLCRRDRIMETRLLDTRVATEFKNFSLPHQQQDTFIALQYQTKALPELADKLSSVVDKLDSLGGRLAENQEQFHSTVRTIYSDFSASMDKSYRESLVGSIQLAAETMKPMLQEAIEEITVETNTLHQQTVHATTEEMKALSDSFISISQEVARTWQSGLEAHRKTADELANKMDRSFESFKDHFEHMATSLLSSVAREINDSIDQQKNLDENRLRLWTDSLEQSQKDTSAHLADIFSEHGNILDVLKSELASLREDETQRIRNAAERDNQMLEGQLGMVKELDSLSKTLTVTVKKQSEGIEQLVHSAEHMFAEISNRFSENVNKETSHFVDVADRIAVSAVEMAGWGDTFGTAVNTFIQSNNTLIEKLDHIEEALEKVTGRSDDQLAYYVAQAREIIDQCMLSQKEFFEQLHQLRPENEMGFEDEK